MGVGEGMIGKLEESLFPDISDETTLNRIQHFVAERFPNITNGLVYLVTLGRSVSAYRNFVFYYYSQLAVP